MKNIVHWCKPKKMWTSHTYKSCNKAQKILIVGEWETETKPNKKDNPRGWVKTIHTNVIISPTDEELRNYEKVEKLTYDKVTVEFSHNKGNCLLFDEEGCFLIRRR